MRWFKNLLKTFSQNEAKSKKNNLKSSSPLLELSETHLKAAQLAAALSWEISTDSLPIAHLHLTQSKTDNSSPKKDYTNKHKASIVKRIVSERDDDPELIANMNALGKLRDLPRGSQVDSRISAIQSLLGNREVFRTLHNLRWPHGVVCPRCHSTNVVRRDPPFDAEDARFYYECLNCKGSGNPSGFDDLTGLPIENAIHALRQWILCWYLLGFCSIGKIAKILGLSFAEVAELASLGSNLVELPEGTLYSSYSTKAKRSTEEKRHQQTHTDEENTRSASLGRYKPGPKSKL